MYIKDLLKILSEDFNIFPPLKSHMRTAHHPTLTVQVSPTVNTVNCHPSVFHPSLVCLTFHHYVFFPLLSLSLSHTMQHPFFREKSSLIFSPAQQNSFRSRRSTSCALGLFSRSVCFPCDLLPNFPENCALCGHFSHFTRRENEGCKHTPSIRLRQGCHLIEMVCFE